MRKGHRNSLTAVFAGLALGLGHACAQEAGPAGQRPDLAITYTVLRSNAPPGGSAHFYAYGGSATFAWPVKLNGLALLGDVTAAHASAISSSNYDLTLASYTVGGRYTLPVRRALLRPFADALIGLAHASGSLVPNDGTSFALKTGGGLDLRLTPQFSLRAVEVDYLLTDFDNGSGNRQNMLKMSAGGVYRF